MVFIRRRGISTAQAQALIDAETPGKWTYDVQAVTSPDGHNVTLVSGPMVLEEDFVP